MLQKLPTKAWVRTKVPIFSPVLFLQANPTKDCATNIKIYTEPDLQVLKEQLHLDLNTMTQNLKPEHTSYSHKQNLDSLRGHYCDLVLVGPKYF